MSVSLYLMIIFTNLVITLAVSFYIGRIIIFEIKRRIETGEWAKKE